MYFIAGDTRHSILWTDMQIELQLNPLWPVYTASSDQVLGYAEGAPVGAAKTGLLGGDNTPAPAPADNTPAAADNAPSPSDNSQPATVTLNRGDNLTRIAAQYGTTIDAILAANGLPDANRIYAGQTLVIPSGDSTAQADDAPAPAPVADAAAPAPEAPAAAAAPDDTATADNTTTYTVQPGDSAFRIARNFGVDQQALLDANGITNPNRVYVGQVLTIPGSSS